MIWLESPSALLITAFLRLSKFKKCKDLAKPKTRSFLQYPDNNKTVNTKKTMILQSTKTVGTYARVVQRILDSGRSVR